ncbi:MAG: NDP-sugar synthase [Thermoprotei archaeon]|nr:MAG: NDP-sugar synthase [Thermoprotei archaeon]
MIKAIILTGGFATRLRPLTLTRPKSLLPILDKPLLDWIIEQLSRSGISNIILSVRYLAEMIKKRYGTGIDYGVSIDYAEEVKPLGDAGPIRYINELQELNETFLVIYGDVFSNVNYQEVINFHRKRGGIATIVLTEVEDPSRYGVAVLDEESRILKFVEKPPKEQAPSNTINAGVYVFEPEVIKYIPKRYPCKLAKEVIPKIVSEGLAYGYVYKGLWFDIGVPMDYLRANIEALKFFYPRGYVANDTEVNDVEILHPTYISRSVKINKGSKIGPYTIIGRDCNIANTVRIKNSLLFNNVIIESGSYIDSAIISERCVIGKWVRIEPQCVVGDEVVISDEVFISRGTIILPFKEIDSNIIEGGRVIL